MSDRTANDERGTMNAESVYRTRRHGEGPVLSGVEGVTRRCRRVPASPRRCPLVHHSAFIVRHSSFCTPPWLSLLCLVLLVGLAGCFAKEPRYPADHARYQKITATVEDLQQAYAKRDASGFRALLLPSVLLDRVEVDVAKDFESFEEITLDISIDRIVIDGEAIDVFVHWQGKWKKKQDEAGSLERGHGILRFVGMHSILLKSVEGDVPFGMVARKATSESQKSGPS